MKESELAEEAPKLALHIILFVPAGTRSRLRPCPCKHAVRPATITLKIKPKACWVRICSKHDDTHMHTHTHSHTHISISTYLYTQMSEYLCLCVSMSLIISLISISLSLSTSSIIHIYIYICVCASGCVSATTSELYTDAQVQVETPTMLRHPAIARGNRATESSFGSFMCSGVQGLMHPQRIPCLVV